MTKHIFHASSLIDGVLVRGQQMSVSPSTIRFKLLAECITLFAEMRDLARTRFREKSEFIVGAVDEYETAIRFLAWRGGGEITVDRRDGDGDCPSCGTPITKFRPSSEYNKDHWIILCRECDEQFMEAQVKLCSFEGFGTEAI